MGICTGCKSAASIFCYEHKRNVCEKCLVSSIGEHKGCFARPYLQWLSDESFVSGCRFCGAVVDKDAVRLPCYDVYHSACLFKLLSQLNSKRVQWEDLKCPECKIGIFTSHGVLNEHVMAVFSKVENPWRKDVQKIPTKEPIMTETKPLLAQQQSAVILGPYSTNHIANNNKKSTSPPPIPSYLTIPPREKFASSRPSQIKSDGHFAAMKQILINCITLRNLRVFLRHVSPRGTLVLCLFFAALFFLIKVYSSHSVVQ